MPDDSSTAEDGELLGDDRLLRFQNRAQLGDRKGLTASEQLDDPETKRVPDRFQYSNRRVHHLARHRPVSEAANRKRWGPLCHLTLLVGEITVILPQGSRGIEDKS
jgi:hypothetical protein